MFKFKLFMKILSLLYSHLIMISQLHQVDFIWETWQHFEGLYISYPIYARSGHNFNSHLLMACLAPLSIIGLCWTPSVHARTPCARYIYQMRLLFGCSQFGSYSRLLIGCSEIGSCSICQVLRIQSADLNRSDRCYLNRSMLQSSIF